MYLYIFMTSNKKPNLCSQQLGRNFCSGRNYIVLSSSILAFVMEAKIIASLLLFAGDCNVQLHMVFSTNLNLLTFRLCKKVDNFPLILRFRSNLLNDCKLLSHLTIQKLVLCTVKKGVAVFLSPAMQDVTYQTLPGWE